MLAAFRGGFDLLIKGFGLAGTSISVLKALFIYAGDQSLARKARKSADEVDLCLSRLAKLENEKLTLTPEIEQYKLQLREDLQEQLETLERVRNLKHRREVERNAEPTGIKRWLLLYKPFSFDGWLIHSLFYSSLLLATATVIEFVVIPIFSKNYSYEDVGVLLLGGPMFGLLAFYFRSISLRMKTVRNAILTGSIKHPNSDLNWLRRSLLIFKKGDGLWALRALFYLCLVEVASLHWLLDDVDDRYFPIIIIGEFLAFAWVFRADALSRRAKKRLELLPTPEAVQSKQPSEIQINPAKASQS